MTQSILVLNAGSSSIKFAVFHADGAEPGERALSGQVAGIRETPHLVVADARGKRDVPLRLSASAGDAPARALNALLDWLDDALDGTRLAAVGHRVVHGGERFAAPVRIDDAVMRSLQALVPIARLHQPYEIEAIRALEARKPELPQVACFDTAFHRTLPAVAQLFPLPRAIIDSGVRRYGFHGLSYAYIATRLPELFAGSATAPDRARVVVAHLGSGSSLCALQGGRSIATTMGFTALDGLMMATRAGSVDPGILLYLMQERGMSVDELSDMLYQRSGLLGVSGISANMSELLASADPHAREAVELYVYCLVREAGALIACLGGIDALIFTAGIGEHVAAVRAQVCAALSWLGIELDIDANTRHERRISTPASALPVWVIPTDEELMIARATLRLTACAH